MECELCDSERIVKLDIDNVSEVKGTVSGIEFSAYIPMDIGIGEDDEINFEYCLECGHIQGDFPMPTTELEDERSLELRS